MKNSELLNYLQGRETPCYIYDSELIRSQYTSLRAAIPANFKILYSLKANPHPQIIRLLKELGSSFDVASFNELKTVLESGADPAEISFVGPGKTAAEIRYAISERVGLLVVESVDELRAIAQAAKDAGKTQNISLRVNPKEFYDPTGRKRLNRSIQFGIDEEDLGRVFEILTNLGSVRFVGIHTHVQSQILVAEYIIQNFAMTRTLFTDLKTRFAPDASVINFGGGFGIPYLESETKLDLSALKAGLEPFSDLAAPLRPYVETGRFIVGPAGYFVVKVQYRKESRGKKILVVDGGLNNNFSVVGACQFERRNYIAKALGKEGDAPQEKYTIVGPSCFSMDTLASDILLPEMQIGDAICFFNSGCYGRTFSPNFFLGQKIANEYFV